MTAPLFASILGIAVLDSLNPSLFIAQFYLLTTPRPIPRILAYIAGVMLVNFVGGVLIFAGARTLINDWIASLTPDTMRLLQLALGAAVLAFGLWYKAAPSAAEAAKPRSLLPVHTFLLGMVVMVNELTTALPYFVAIERIASAQMHGAANLLTLAAYNLVFSLPLLGFVGLYAAYRERFSAQIARVSEVVRVWTPRVIKWLSIGFGLLLIAGSIPT